MLCPSAVTAVCAALELHPSTAPPQQCQGPLKVRGAGTQTFAVIYWALSLYSLVNQVNAKVFIK